MQRHAAPAPRPSPSPRELDPSTIVTPHAHDEWALATRVPADPTVTSVAARSSSSPALTPEQVRLDAYREAYAGPYQVSGASVRAEPQFRMSGGHNDAAAGVKHTGNGPTIDRAVPTVKELLAACRKAGAPDPTHCLLGAPSAHDLVRVTQALIDAGHLPDGPGDIESRVKSMQWKYGIGIDCTDYVLDAALTAQKLPHSSVRFVDKSVTLPMRGCDYFANAVHEYQLDASWSAGASGASYGGVRRDTWLYNESTKQWAQLNPRHIDGGPSFEITPDGPANEPLHGLYRFR